MKRTIAVTLLALNGFAGTSMAQGMPVFDAAALRQAIQQVAAWKQQAEQMSSQLKQLEDQNAALTGSRGLGAILNNPELHATVPADAAQLFQALRSGEAGSLTAQAASIRNAGKTYDCENRSGADRTTCQAFLNSGAQIEALQQNAMRRLNQRTAQISGLQGKINATNDPKSIAELTARLVAESAQVANDANKILILKAMSDSADRAAQQALKERELLSLSRTGDGSETFVYKPYAVK